MSIRPARLDDAGFEDPRMALVKNYKNAGKRERQEAQMGDLLKEIEQALGKMLLKVEEKNIYKE